MGWEWDKIEGPPKGFSKGKPKATSKARPKAFCLAEGGLQYSFEGVH